MQNYLYSIILGAAGGVFSSAGFIFKNTAENKEKKKEQIDWKKFIISVVTSAIIGGVSGYGLDPSAYTVSIGGFVGLFVENIFKGINRRNKKN